VTEKVKVRIDGEVLAASPGQSILQAAREETSRCLRCDIRSAER
jgi:hypothetical protein